MFNFINIPFKYINSLDKTNIEQIDLNPLFL